jgi:hypothetical protein
MKSPLHRILSNLRQDYDFVILDVRSGLSPITRTIAGEPQFRELVSTWLIFHRWTPQHLAGVEDMAKRLATWDWPAFLVRTAYLNPDSVQGASPEYLRWLRRRDTALEEELTRIRNENGNVRGTIASIPFSGVLQWEERILTPSFFRRERVAEGGTEGFEDLASALEEVDGA